VKSIKETIRSDSGFYIGDIKTVENFNTKKKAYDVDCGKVTDKKTGLDLVIVRVPSSHLSGLYSDNNGDQYNIPTGALVLAPLELIANRPISTMTEGRVIFGAGDATFETAGETIKITLPSTEVVEIHTGRTNQ
jgi:hypothetical protein